MRGDTEVAFIKIMHPARAVRLAATLVAVSVGLLGCDILKGLAKSEKHGAIAFDEDTGGWGYSYNQATEERAKTEATKNCSPCTVQLAWQKGCGALAQAESDKKVMGAKTGSTRLAAEGAAKANCLSKGAGPCKVVVWSCNGK